MWAQNGGKVMKPFKWGSGMLMLHNVLSTHQHNKGNKAQLLRVGIC
jgi:hypothetical protein